MVESDKTSFLKSIHVEESSVYVSPLITEDRSVERRLRLRRCSNLMCIAHFGGSADQGDSSQCYSYQKSASRQIGQVDTLHF